MNNYILGIRKQIKQFSDFKTVLDLFQSIQEMLDNPLSFWSLPTLLELANSSKLIEGEKDFYKFLNHFKTLDKITKHPLSFYLLGDSESYFFAGTEQKGKSYFRGFATKHKKREVAGLLPSNSEGEGETKYLTPYLYDVNDINEGMKLLTVPSNEIINILGKNYFLDFLTNLKNMLKFFLRKDVSDSALFKGVINKMLLKITPEIVEDVTEKLFPIPVRTSSGSFTETNLVYAGDLMLDYSSDLKPISYKELTKIPELGKHKLELFNFRFDYKQMVLFELCKIIYRSGGMAEAFAFVENEILSIAQDNTSLVLTSNFIGSYVEKINLINIETDLVEFYVGNPQQAALCYDYCNYMTDISKFVSLNLQKINLEKLKKEKQNYSKANIELVESVWTQVLEKITFNMMGDNLERDLFSSSNLIEKVDYLQYNFTNRAKEGVNLNRYFPFPPVIELAIDAHQETNLLMKEEKHTIDEEEKVIEHRDSSLDTFKKAREAGFSAQKSILYFSLEFINTFGVTRLDVNRYMTLMLLRNNRFLHKSLKKYLGEIVQQRGCGVNFIGGFIYNYSSYTFKKGTKKEIKGAVSITNAMLSFLILPELYKTESEVINFIKQISKEIKKGILDYEREDPSFDELLDKGKYKYILCFLHRLLLSSKVIWDTLKVFKNLLYVKTAEGYDTLFNHMNKIAIQTSGGIDYSSVEKLIKMRNEQFDKGIIEDFSEEKSIDKQGRKTILSNLKHLSVEIDFIVLLKQIKRGEVEILIDIPGNMLDKIYSIDKIEQMGIRNIFDYIYFDFSTASLESVSGIDMLVGFLYFKIGLDKVSILIYNDYKENKNIGFLYRLFDRLLYRNYKEIAKKIIDKIGEYDNDLFTTLSNKYRRVF